MAANRFDEAAAIYREILQKLPDEPGILMNLGMALSMSGQPKEAIQPLSRALELRPTLMPAALFLGQSHLDLGQPEQAIAPLEKFVAAQPANVQARQMLGIRQPDVRTPSAGRRRIPQGDAAGASRCEGLGTGSCKATTRCRRKPWTR